MDATHQKALDPNPPGDNLPLLFLGSDYRSHGTPILKRNETVIAPVTERPLRIGILSYRSNPHCGGQGVYLRHLSRALRDLGHRVEVVSGPA